MECAILQSCVTTLDNGEGVCNLLAVLCVGGRGLLVVGTVGYVPVVRTRNRLRPADAARSAARLPGCIFGQTPVPFDAAFAVLVLCCCCVTTLSTGEGVCNLARSRSHQRSGWRTAFAGSAGHDQ